MKSPVPDKRRERDFLLLGTESLFSFVVKTPIAGRGATSDKCLEESPGNSKEEIGSFLSTFFQSTSERLKLMLIRIEAAVKKMTWTGLIGVKRRMIYPRE